MMVGIDQNVYSDFALQWLLDEYADDGDEIICVHVVDKDARTVEERNYKTKADKMVQRIKSKIPENCAISIKLEYAIGKLHATFQKLVWPLLPVFLVLTKCICTMILTFDYTGIRFKSTSHLCLSLARAAGPWAVFKAW